MNRIARVLAATLVATRLGSALAGAPATPVVEVEEDVYKYQDANNGAGPMWCSGSTCLVRYGNDVFASGLEVVPGAIPLNNCRWLLFGRQQSGWKRQRMAAVALTREPSPLAVFDDSRLFLSHHPTLMQGKTNGPSRSTVLQFSALDLDGPRRELTPEWMGTPNFTEHSYRSFAADGTAHELILFVNAGEWSSFWSFMDSEGNWSARGELRWPYGNDYARKQPIRICYPNVLLRERAVHFCGVSDIVEPNDKWRAFKKELTGRDWDYDFRRLFYTWMPDVRTGAFQNWVEIASREKTCGWITPGDLWLDAGGIVHLVWTERAIDERLREKFFPDARQSHEINYAQLRSGELLLKRNLVKAEEGGSREIPSAPRFQVARDGTLFVVYYVSGTDAGGKAVSENRLLEIGSDGTPSESVRIPLQYPMNSYFTATPRAGSPLSETLDLLGTRAGATNTISYARIVLR